MARFMKKSGLGMLTTAEGGASDPDLAEVRLDPEEYKEMWYRIRQAENAAIETQKKAEKEIEEAYNDANRQLVEYADNLDKEKEDVKKAADKRVAEAEENIKRLEADLEHQIGLNQNLKRIAVERANAKRGLKPKKARSGYIVLFSSQFKERYRNETGEKCVADTWKTVIQTPYDATIPLIQIKSDIWDDLKHSVLYQMGFRTMQPEEKQGEFRRWFKKSDDDSTIEVCGIYRWDYKANFKSSYWEITLWHTLPMDSIPEEFRPAQ